MIPNHTIPSLSGTFGIPTKLSLNSKMPKEPSSPSHSNAQIEQQCINEQIVNRIERGQRTTHGIFHSGRGFGCISGNFEYIYFGDQK